MPDFSRSKFSTKFSPSTLPVVGRVWWRPGCCTFAGYNSLVCPAIRIHSCTRRMHFSTSQRGGGGQCTRQNSAIHPPPPLLLSLHPLSDSGAVPLDQLTSFLSAPPVHIKYSLRFVFIFLDLPARHLILQSIVAPRPAAFCHAFPGGGGGRGDGGCGFHF